MKFYALWDNFLPFLSHFFLFYLSVNLLFIYLLLLAWKHILCGIWPSPWLPKSPSLQCPCCKTVFWCCLCRQAMLTHGWGALALSSSLLFPAPHICAESVTRKGYCSLLLRHWWPIFIFPCAVQRQKKVRPSKGVLMINWSLLPVPECRLELEHAGSPSWIHRKQLGTFLISSSNTHLPLNVWMVFEILPCFMHQSSSGFGYSYLIPFTSPPLLAVPARGRHFKKDVFLCATFMFQFKAMGGAWFPFFWLHLPWWAARLAH